MKLLVVLTAILGVTLAKVHQHPLKRVESGRERMIRDGTWPAYVKEKSARQSGLVGAHGGEPITDYLDVLYTTEIDIGTPAQKFNLALDTASANLWVVDKTCSSQACTNVSRFNSALSSTYVANGEAINLDLCSGFLGQDKVCLGSSGLCYGQQIFAQANTLRGSSRNILDGWIGLAWPSISIDHVAPPFQNIMSSLDQPIFTIWMTQAATGQVAGQITYGAYDNMNCNMSSNGAGIYWSPLSSATYWEFTMTGVTAGSFHVGGNFAATSDSATTFILGPQADIDGIGLSLGGTYHEQFQLYQINCTATPPPITLLINARSYAINYKNYIINYGRGFCFLAIHANTDPGPTWVLGDTFIRQFCNVFDFGNQRIGFAKANH